MTTRASKACDGCRVRKVRCDGGLPCSQCAHLHLSCRFSAPTTRRRPGVRNRIVDQLRDRDSRRDADGHHHRHDLSHQPPFHQNGGSSPPTSSSRPAITSVAGIINADPVTSPSAASTTTLAASSPDTYADDFFLGLIPDYEKHVYPVNPIITAEEIRATVPLMHTSHENAALLYAFAAVTINLTQTSRTLNGNGDVAAQITDLIRRCLASHRLAEMGPVTGSSGAPIGELPVTVKRIMTCIFLEISLMAFRLFQRSFAILREAITLVQTLKVFQYDSPSSPDPPTDRREVARRQRLYWECYIHERFVNVMSGCPAILPPLSTGLPNTDPTIPPHVDAGFRCLIGLFRLMDESFLEHWNAQQDRARQLPSPMTAQWIESKQAELDRHEADTDINDDRLRAASGCGLTELQRADLLVTRMWLRTLVWQLALSRRLLRSAPPQTTHQGLSLHFPAARLSSELRSLVCRLASVASIATHGSGILQKLFEITTTVADVLALPPGQHEAAEGAGVRSRVEDFVFLVGFLFRFERISDEERRYMRDKLALLQPVYPDVDFGNLVV